MRCRGLHANVFKGKKTAQFNGLFAEDGFREMPKIKQYYAVDMVFLLIATSIDRSLCLEGCCELSRMYVQYGDIVNRVLVDQRDKSRVDGELMVLRPETEKSNRVVEIVCVVKPPWFMYSNVTTSRSCSR